MMTGELISHPHSRLLKVGVWLGALAVLALVYVQSLLNARYFGVPSAPFGLALLCLACLALLWWTGFHALADEVVDNGAVLVIKRGSRQERINFHDIRTVAVTSRLAIHCLLISLRVPCGLGNEVIFLPVRTLKSRYAALESMALQLTARALRSQPAPIHR
jgi:hypothetical protein